MTRERDPFRRRRAGSRIAGPSALSRSVGIPRRCAVPLTAALLAGCAAATPAPLPGRLTPTACEKRALMTGQPRDLTSVEAVAHDMYWGLLAPESCPDAGGRLDGGLIAR